MQAGEGAQDQAARHAQRLERLRAEHAATGSEESRQAVSRAEGLLHAWATGAEGERQVAQTLHGLADRGWTALHDIRWPDRPQANIDHVALGPGGVVVVDAKNWTGSVTVRDGVLRQNGYRREEAVHGVADATAAVTALLAPEHRTAVRGVLCLAGQELPPVVAPNGIAIVGQAHLVGLLASLGPRLSPYEVADVGRYLSSWLDGPVQRPASRGRSRTRQHRPGPPAVRGGRRPAARRPASGRTSKALVPGLLRLALTIGTLFAILALLPPLLEHVTSQITQGVAPTPAVTVAPVVPEPVVEPPVVTTTG